MKNDPNLRDDDRDLLRAVLAQPAAFNDACYEATVELMSALAAGKLDGEALQLAQELRDENEEAAEVFALFARRESAVPDLGQPLAAVQQFFDGLALALREFYAGLSVNQMLAAGEEEIREKHIAVGNATATLRQIKRPDNFYEIELIVPASANLDPAQLAGYALKIVDRPDPLVFERRRNGNLVATAVLPPLVDAPEKEIVIVPMPAADQDHATPAS